jgi:hypothetical protein
MRPIFHLTDVPVFHRIEMNVIHMTLEILFVAQGVFPVAPLSDAALSLAGTAF